MAVVVAIGLAGCASTGSSGTPCESCDYGYVPVGKRSERRVWCIKDGKTLDCKKSPPECPECAKAVQR
jgi:hypothetical protein